MTKVLTAQRFFALPLEKCTPDLEAAFFSSLKMRNGTFKTTRASRFAEIEAHIRPIVANRAHQLRNVLDVGASSGMTTLEFADFLEAQGAKVRLVATDLFAHAHLIRLPGGIRVLTDSSGFPLQYDIGGMVVRAWSRRIDYATLTAIPRFIARSFIQYCAPQKIRRAQTEPVELMSRRLSLRANVQLVEDDIMIYSPQFAGGFDFVRAANILNLDYFSGEQLKLGLHNIRSYMRGPGSLLLVTRTIGKSEKNAGSLFELGGNGRFAEIQHTGAGSEIKDLVLLAGT